MTSEDEAWEQERARIEEELLLREQRLRKVEEEVAALRFKIQHAAAGTVSDTARAVTAERYRRKLHSDVSRKLKHRDQVQSEVASARERLAQMGEHVMHGAAVDDTE